MATGLSTNTDLICEAANPALHISILRDMNTVAK